jgi:NAD(P) transhydrogenase
LVPARPGSRVAIQATKLNKRVAIIERKAVLGGVCINTRTIPSKTLREAALYLSGYRLRGLYGPSSTVKQNITMEDLLFRTNHVIRNEIDVDAPPVDAQSHRGVQRRGVLHRSTLRSTITTSAVHGVRATSPTAHVVIATGTEVTGEENIAFDGQPHRL